MMVLVVAALPVLIGLLLSATAQPMARRMRPSVAARLVVGLALTSALCIGLVLGAAAVQEDVRIIPYPRVNEWFEPAPYYRDGVSLILGRAALVVVAVLLAAAAVRAVRSVHAVYVGRRAAAGMTPVEDRLVLLNDAVPVAYSIPGRGGRIVVSTGMFAALSAPERRVLLAHEAAHLRHRHYIYLHLVRLAAAANPLLRPAVASVVLAVERWADEDAAARVGDRRLTAHALAHAALARSNAPRVRVPVGAGALPVADHAVVSRVQMLLGPAPASRIATTGVVLAFALLSWVAAVLVAIWAV